MNPLQYTSEEMFSSTELIRKSKKVFDKLQKKEIEKAIILRDGKPSFMLLDFSTYEDIMSEYLSLKNILDDENINKTQNTSSNTINQIEQNKQEDDISNIDEMDLENALAEIDNLNLEDFDDEIANIEEQTDEKEPLKEFWE